MPVAFASRAPAEAVDYLESKVVGGRFSFAWQDVWQEEHTRSFVVAKAMTRDLLEDIHGGLLDALKAGKTKAQFMDELTPLLQAKGWWGKQRVADPTTGVDQIAQLGSPRRLALIYDVNMRMAHSAGQWERIQRSAEDRPFLRYKHTPQEHPRLEHQAWDGITLPIGHAFWRTHWTPNGWKCKCWVQSLRRAEDITSEDELKAKGAYATQPYRNKRTGQVTDVPFGIDPGFGYNVGQARLANFVPPPAPERQRDQVIGPRTPRALPEPLAPRKPPLGAQIRPDLAADPQSTFDAFSKVLGKAEGEVFVDKAQVPLVVGRGLFQVKDAAGQAIAAKEHLEARAAYAELLAAALRDPDEIWLSMQRRADGTSMLVRNYVAAYDLGEGERQWFVASFHERDGAWWGATAFAPGKRNRRGSQASYTNIAARVGALVYRRK